MARLMLAAARSPDERGTARFRQGVALLRLGERESGNERLAEAVTVFRAALKEYPRKRAPLDWARTRTILPTR